MSCLNLTLSPLVASQSFSLSSLPSFCPRYGGMEHIQGRVARQMRERISPPPPPLSRVVCCVSSSSLPRLVHELAVASCKGEDCLSRGLPHLCLHCFALRCSSPPAPHSPCPRLSGPRCPARSVSRAGGGGGQCNGAGRGDGPCSRCCLTRRWRGEADWPGRWARHSPPCSPTSQGRNGTSC